MHTYTHIALVLPLCKLFLPEDSVLQGAAIAGSIVPDIPIIAFGIKKCLRKKDGPAGRKIDLSHHILHSLVIWLCLTWFSFNLLLVAGHLAAGMPSCLLPHLWIIFLFPPFALGGTHHAAVDIVSHRKRKGRKGWFEILLTKTYFWPFYQWELKKLKLFDYRGWLPKRCKKKSHEKSWLNLVTIQEIVISLICLGLYFLL